MPGLTVRVATGADVREFAAWRHDPPYDVYDITQPVDEAVEYFLGIGCRVIDRDGELAAFFTFGDDAHVPGGDYSAPGLDIGLGMKPSLTGQGLGGSFVRTVVEHAAALTRDPLRVTIAIGNARARRVWGTHGFVESQRFDSPEPVLGATEFVVLVRL
jgi:RimJ/RimL family protein N-acetyltransferase